MHWSSATQATLHLIELEKNFIWKTGILFELKEFLDNAALVVIVSFIDGYVKNLSTVSPSRTKKRKYFKFLVLPKSNFHNFT